GSRREVHRPLSRRANRLNQPTYVRTLHLVDATQRAADQVRGAQAEQMLRDKLMDPLGAAVGGYYLLRSESLTLMHDWPNNFANWIEWLPDGAIIHAWQLLL